MKKFLKRLAITIGTAGLILAVLILVRLVYVDHMKQSALNGDPEAQFNLGLMYYMGSWVPQNYQESAVWLRKAAEQDVITAQTNMGIMYMQGQGVPQNLDEAFRWFRKAAEQGDVKAQAELGLMYKNGEGVPQNFDEAVRWLRKAAEQENDLGLMGMAALYEGGLGVPRDHREAYFWVSIAANNDVPDAEKIRSAIASKISFEDQEAIKVRLRKWKRDTK